MSTIPTCSLQQKSFQRRSCTQPAITFRKTTSRINDWDLKEAQSLDMYVGEDGRKFLRHYLLDFGSSLGADDKPMEYYHGREYGLDLRSITKEIFSLGLYESANEKRARIISS